MKQNIQLQKLPPPIVQSLRNAYYQVLASDEQFLKELHDLWHYFYPRKGEKSLNEWREDPHIKGFAERWKLPSGSTTPMPVTKRATFAYPDGVEELILTLIVNPEPPKAIECTPHMHTRPSDEQAEPYPDPPQIGFGAYFPELEPVEDYIERELKRVRERLTRHTQECKEWVRRHGVLPVGASGLGKWRDPDYLERVAQQVYLRVVKGWTWGQIMQHYKAKWGIGKQKGDVTDECGQVDDSAIRTSVYRSTMTALQVLRISDG